MRSKLQKRGVELVRSAKVQISLLTKTEARKNTFFSSKYMKRSENLYYEKAPEVCKQ